MFRRILLVFTDPELRTKLIQTILLLIIARLLAHIPIPVLRTQDISPLIDNDAVFGLLNTVSGGSYGRLSFVMLGVGPYITASIVMQLLGVLIPRIQEIQKEEGEQGQQKINRWTRILTVPLAALNSWAILQFLSNGSVEGVKQIDLPPILREPSITWQTFGYWLAVITAMTAGSIIMMWIGEIITEYKMANGISLLILSGIVVRIPNQITKYWTYIYPNLQDLFSRFSWGKFTNWNVWKAFLWENPSWDPTRSFLLFVFMFVVSLLLVVFMNDAVRKLVVVYSRRGHSEGNSRTLSGVQADLPIKVNAAGVIPIIFAVSFILFPTIISRFFATSNLESLRNTASAVETYLSTQPKEVIPGAPSDFLGFYKVETKEQLDRAFADDRTVGQDLFGFTLTSIKDTRNVFLEGTPLRFDLPALNFGGSNQWAIRWNGVLAYNLFYFILIIYFTYFYTSTIGFKTDDVADNLQKSSAYIPGFKPGRETQEYLSYVANRLNVVGSVFLAVIALAPIILGRSLNFGDGTINSIVGGTTLLILVSVTIETLKKIEAQATSIDYDRFIKY
jgi:preprotein translocase subunit SecY